MFFEISLFFKITSDHIYVFFIFYLHTWQHEPGNETWPDLSPPPLNKGFPMLKKLIFLKSILVVWIMFCHALRIQKRHGSTCPPPPRSQSQSFHILPQRV